MFQKHACPCKVLEKSMPQTTYSSSKNDMYIMDFPTAHRLRHKKTTAAQEDNSGTSYHPDPVLPHSVLPRLPSSQQRTPDRSEHCLRAPDLSGHCWTSTASARSQWQCPCQRECQNTMSNGMPHIRPNKIK